MLVSELEKKAEIRMSTASRLKRSPSGASFKWKFGLLAYCDGGENFAV